MSHSRDKADAERLLARALGPADPELSCEQCFEVLDRYIELELADSMLPRRCRACEPISRAALPATRTTAACSPF